MGEKKKKEARMLHPLRLEASLKFILLLASAENWRPLRSKKNSSDKELGVGWVSIAVFNEKYTKDDKHNKDYVLGLGKKIERFQVRRIIKDLIQIGAISQRRLDTNPMRGSSKIHYVLNTDDDACMTILKLFLQNYSKYYKEYELFKKLPFYKHCILTSSRDIIEKALRKNFAEIRAKIIPPIDPKLPVQEFMKQSITTMIPALQYKRYVDRCLSYYCNNPSFQQILVKDPKKLHELVEKYPTAPPELLLRTVTSSVLLTDYLEGKLDKSVYAAEIQKMHELFKDNLFAVTMLDMYTKTKSDSNERKRHLTFFETVEAVEQNLYHNQKQEASKKNTLN